ncbi:hypothetical protein TrST_g12991 [Triparma strigata]|uniref:Uncharacterized protein n=1 Tax=Triparma strigata TaxID=1606541 RepID=A0A9W7EQJ9_9STRA|nr:hypothetical protein TrST_g12991 [Triparma strigata]
MRSSFLLFCFLCAVVSPSSGSSQEQGPLQGSPASPGKNPAAMSDAELIDSMFSNPDKKKGKGGRGQGSGDEDDDENDKDGDGGDGRAAENPIQTEGSEEPYLAGYTLNPDGTTRQITLQLDEESIPIQWRKKMKVGEELFRAKDWKGSTEVFKDILNGYGYRNIKDFYKYKLHLYYASSLMHLNELDLSLNDITTDITNYLERAIHFVGDGGGGDYDVYYNDNKYDNENNNNIDDSVASRHLDGFEVYYKLGELNVITNDLNRALTYFKLCLHLDPKNLQASQSVGVIYILLGDFNTGRHYLRRAVEEWEHTGNNFLHAMKAKEDLELDRMGHWVLDYLLSIFSLDSAWKLGDSFRWEGGDATSKQTPYDFAMLSYFIDQPSLFTPRMHYDLGLTLCELGVWERGIIHMRDYGVKAMKELEVSGSLDEYGEKNLAIMSVREVLNAPLVLEAEGQGREMWGKILERCGGKERRRAPPLDELQDAVETLPLLHYLEGDKGEGRSVAKRLEKYMRAMNPELNFVSKFLSLPNILEVSSEEKYLGESDDEGDADERVRVAIVSQYFCSHPVGRLALPIIASLPRDKFKVTVFSFPTIVDSWAQAISWSADNYVGLPNDFVKASQKIASSNSDILLYADHSDPISCLLSYQRLAPVQVGFYVRGAVHTSGLAQLDYYLQPEVVGGVSDEFGAEQEVHEDQQIVTLSGFGLPFDPPQRDQTDLGRNDVKFEFGGRKFFANDNLYLVTSSVPTGISPKYDLVFKELLELDPNALIVLVPDVAEMRLWSAPSSATSARLGPQQWCVRLLKRIRTGLSAQDQSRIFMMKPLPVEERTDLLGIACSILDFGDSITSLEALALNVPVVCIGGVGGLGCGVNDKIGGAAQRHCVANGLEEMAEKAKIIGTDSHIRGQVIDCVDEAKRSGILDNVIQMIGATTGGEEIAEFLWTAGVSWARMRDDIMKNL